MAKQTFKAVHFTDYQSFTIAFSPKETELYKMVAGLSTLEVQELLGTASYATLKQNAENEGRTINQYAKRILQSKLDNSKQESKKFHTKDVTFSNSLSVPFQRWYPYIEGYSPNFVSSLIETYCKDATLIYEPFAGTGTTLFASDKYNINTVFSEVNPLLRFLIETKTTVMSLSVEARIELAAALKEEATDIFEKIKKHKASIKLKHTYTRVFGSSVYFPEDQLKLILKLRTYIDQLYETGRNTLADLMSVAVFASLLPVSYLKKQGDVRFKTEKEKETEMQILQDILPNKLNDIHEDLLNFDYKLTSNHSLATSNAKNIGDFDIEQTISAVITSPPYLNGTNYFRNTKLELWFLKYLTKDTDLRLFRDEALTSGINDVKKEYRKTAASLQSPLLDKTLENLTNNAYDQRIPLMAKCYFAEMAQLFGGLTKHLANEASILIDLGDSIFSGVHIQTDYILADILKAFGYELKDKIILRQRRSRNGSVLSQVLLVFKYTQRKNEYN